jgi:MOSC domain-containing protein
VLVRSPRGGELDVADPALAAEFGPGVRVIKQDRGVFDTMPLSLLTTQTLAGLGRPAGTGLAAGRFRPNLLVDAPGRDFPEDAWVGRVLRIGGLRMRVDQRDTRCVMVTIDPVTLLRDPVILRAIARERDNKLGVYGTTVEPGPVAVGDPVELEP